MKKSLAVFLIAAFMAPAYAAPVAAVKAPTPKVVKAKTKAKVKGKIGAVVAMSKVPTLEAVKKPPPPQEIKFKDISKKDPNYSLIKKAVLDYQVMSGFPDGTYRPRAAVEEPEIRQAVKQALIYLEKKYEISLSDNFYEPPVKPEIKVTKPSTAEAKKKTAKVAKPAPPAVKAATRLELASALAQGLKRVLERYEIALPALSTAEAKTIIKDIKPASEVVSDIKLLMHYGFISVRDVTKKGKKVKAREVLFEGQKKLNRLDLTFAAVKFVEKSDLIIARLPAEKLQALQKKRAPGKMAAAPLVEKAMVMGRPQAYLSGGWGHINESASATNNWLGFGGAAAYGNNFQLWKLQGDYEISGKYGLNQVVYLTPAGGGGASGGVVAENRYDLDLNTIYPVINFYGFQGKLLLGAKYANLSNPVAPTSFLAFNAGVATVFPLFDRKLLGRAFYSLIPGTTTRNGSVLGQPNLILNYEAGTDVQIMQTPFMAGYMGETMFLNGGTYTRFYNLIFFRYNLL